MATQLYSEQVKAAFTLVYYALTSTYIQVNIRERTLAVPILSSLHAKFNMAPLSLRKSSQHVLNYSNSGVFLFSCYQKPNVI